MLGHQTWLDKIHAYIPLLGKITIDIILHWMESTVNVTQKPSICIHSQFEYY